MSALKTANLVISFLLELALVGSLAFWGLTLSIPVLGRVLLGLVLPALVVVFWAIFMAPRAVRRIRTSWKPLVALALFAGASALLISSGHAMIGSTFAVVAVLNTIGVYALRSYPSRLDVNLQTRSS